MAYLATGNSSEIFDQLQAFIDQSIEQASNAIDAPNEISIATLAWIGITTIMNLVQLGMTVKIKKKCKTKTLLCHQGTMPEGMKKNIPQK